MQRSMWVVGLLSVQAGMLALSGCARPRGEPPKMPPPKVTVAYPTRGTVQGYWEYNGYIEPFETVNVRTRIRGFLEKVAFREGAEVKKDDLLYEIDRREYEAMLTRVKADQLKADAELRRASADEDRARRSREKSAISEEEYVQKIAAKEVAQAVVKQAQAQVEVAELDLSFTKIRSPIDGVVNRTLVTPGNLVGYNESTLLTTIVRVDKVYVFFDVPERNLVEYERQARKEKLPTAIDRTIPIEVGLEGESGYPHPGYIDFRENRVDTGTGTVRIRGELPNPDRVLFPGLYARVRVPRGPEREAILIPESALLSDQRGRYVFVVKPDNTVAYHPVVLGARKGNLIAIESGVTEQDRVIVNGLQRARPGAPVTPEEAPAARAEAKTAAK